MRVVIAGAGEVGYQIMGALYREGVDIVVIDNNPDILELLREEFNVTTIEGSATDADTLDKAGVGSADLFLAVTNFDETNIIACLMASEAGVPKKIARVKTIDSGQGVSVSERAHLGIDLMINPYEVAAEHLAHLVEHPQVTDFNQFLSQRVLLVRFLIKAGNPLAGTTVFSFGQNAHIPHTLIALIQREGHSIIPDAEHVIQVMDQVYFFCEREQLARLSHYLGFSTKPSKRVFINGGGRIGYSLARRLEKHTSDVRLMEISQEKCDNLSQLLERTLVLHADGADARALRSEGVDHADTFLSVTNQDPVNVISSMLAKQIGARQAVALVKQPEFIPILMNRCLVDIAFSPRLLTARKLLRFVRGEDLQAYYAFPQSDVELLEMEIAPGAPCDRKSLASLNLPKGFLIGAVIRGDSIFIPRGQDALLAHDRVLLLQQRRNRRVTHELFTSRTAPGVKQAQANAHSAAGAAAP